jgi:hypothetical protein
MAPRSCFSPLGEKLVIVGNAQHCTLRLSVVELIRAGASFLGAIAPMLGVVEEGPMSHLLQPAVK